MGVIKRGVIRGATSTGGGDITVVGGGIIDVVTTGSIVRVSAASTGGGFTESSARGVFLTPTNITTGGGISASVSGVSVHLSALSLGATQVQLDTRYVKLSSQSKIGSSTIFSLLIEQNAVTRPFLTYSSNTIGLGNTTDATNFTGVRNLIGHPTFGLTISNFANEVKWPVSAATEGQILAVGPANQLIWSTPTGGGDLTQVIADGRYVRLSAANTIGSSWSIGKAEDRKIIDYLGGSVIVGNETDSTTLINVNIVQGNSSYGLNIMNNGSQVAWPVSAATEGQVLAVGAGDQLIWSTPTVGITEVSADSKYEVKARFTAQSSGVTPIVIWEKELASGQITSFCAFGHAQKVGNKAKSTNWTINFAAYENLGSVFLVGGSYQSVINGSSYSLYPDVSANAVKLYATGEVGDTVNWVASVKEIS